MNTTNDTCSGASPAPKARHAFFNKIWEKKRKDDVAIKAAQSSSSSSSSSSAPPPPTPQPTSTAAPAVSGAKARWVDQRAAGKQPFSSARYSFCASMSSESASRAFFFASRKFLHPPQARQNTKQQSILFCNPRGIQLHGDYPHEDLLPFSAEEAAKAHALSLLADNRRGNEGSIEHACEELELDARGRYWIRGMSVRKACLTEKQVTAIIWAIKALRALEKIAYLLDEMGLGKTITAIAIILRRIFQPTPLTPSPNLQLSLSQSVYLHSGSAPFSNGQPLNLSSLFTRLVTRLILAQQCCGSERRRSDGSGRRGNGLFGRLPWIWDRRIVSSSMGVRDDNPSEDDRNGHASPPIS